MYIPEFITELTTLLKNSLMKTLKLLLYCSLVLTTILWSCSNNESIIENLPDPEQSETMQLVLDELETLYNEDGTEIDGMHPSDNMIFDFCFEFRVCISN